MLYDLSVLSQLASNKQQLPSLQMTRRRLLSSTAVLALATATASVGPKAVWAAGAVSADQRVTLVRMARDIYPHDTLLPDTPYVQAVDKILSEAEGDADVRKMVVDGVADLESRASSIYGKAYVDVSDPDKREGILRAIELTDFFQKFRGELLMGIYNNQELWPKFGYDGSSWEKGGFMDSFDKIDWL